VSDLVIRTMTAAAAAADRALEEAAAALGSGRSRRSSPMTEISGLRLPLWEPPGAWAESAACAQVDPDLWFPEQGQAAMTRAAKAICAACPVRAECLGYALRRGEVHGIWGGLDYTQRRQWQRQHGIPGGGRCWQCGTPLPPPETGHRRRYCSDRCRYRAARRREVAA
jgi:WhiB family redox-sensing transcriptional regulator